MGIGPDLEKIASAKGMESTSAALIEVAARGTFAFYAAKNGYEERIRLLDCFTSLNELYINIVATSLVNPLQCNNESDS